MQGECKSGFDVKRVQYEETLSIRYRIPGSGTGGGQHGTDSPKNREQKLALNPSGHID